MNRQRGSTMLRVLEILEQIAQAEKPVTATELNDMLSLPKSTAHRLCSMLEAEGYLQKRLDGKRYMPGPKLQTLAIGVLTHSQFRAQRHAILMSLSQEIGETCNLSYPDGSQMVYADRVETQWPLRLQLTVGTRVPLHCTASGKMYLSSLPKAKRANMASHLELTSHTSNSITDSEQLLENLEKIRRQDFSTDNEEFVDGMIAVAVPIRDKRGRVFSTISFHAPVVRMRLVVAEQYVPRMHSAAQELSRLVET
ncbi:MAG: IclR family transcriptional regulator [Pseudomonadota bacterium]